MSFKNIFGTNTKANKAFEMTVSLDKKKNIITIRVSGNLNAQNSSRFKSRLDKILSKGVKYIIIDLAQVEYLSSVAIGILLNAFNTLHKHGGVLCLTSVNEGIRDVLELLNFTSILPIFESSEAAKTINLPWKPAAPRPRETPTKETIPAPSFKSGPEDFRIDFNVEKCCGAGDCQIESPSNWNITEGKASYNKQSFGPEHLNSELAAARSCPANAINIFNKNTNSYIYQDGEESEPADTPTIDSPTDSKPPAGFIEMQVIRNIELSPSVKQTVFVPRQEETPIFKPGQFVSVFIQDGKGNPVRRAYSLAGKAGLPDLQLCVKRVPEGRGSNFIHNLKAGDSFYCGAPSGAFVFQDSHPAKQLYFVGTGTGIAPLRSMIHHIFKSDSASTIRKHLQAIHLIHGIRDESEVLYEDEWRLLAAAWPAFRYTIALSKAESNTHRQKGRVTDVLTNLSMDPDSLFYFCGNSAMIADSRKILRKGGLAEERIISEDFF